MSQDFNWTQAPDISGHEEVVEKFRRGCESGDLPENYVVRFDEYFVVYDTKSKTPSKSSEINVDKPYVPRVGGLTEAYELGRDEPDIFYKLLAKKNHGGMVGDTYNTPCDLLFVRTEHKQIYKTVHTVRMFVEGDYHDQITRICKARGESAQQAGARMFVMKDAMAMRHEFQCRTRRRPIRVNAARYDAQKRRQHRIQQATPPWADLYEIQKLHTEVYNRNKEAGERLWHLDHEIPLYAVDETGTHVASGLHIPANLKPMLARDNQKKSNKLHRSAA